MQLCEETISLLEGALSRFGDVEEGALHELWDRPARRTSGGACSRQGRHARLTRNRATAVLGAFALAPREKQYASLIFSPDLARLRPYTAVHHLKLLHLASTKGAFAQGDCEALWELGVPRLMQIARRGTGATDDDLLVIGNILCTLFAGAVLHPSAFADEWRTLWRQAGRRGLLRSRFFHLQLAMVGTFTGHCGPHVD
jgi:hypothetical protein